MAGLARMFGSSGALVAVLALPGVGLDEAEPPAVELRAAELDTAELDASELDHARAELTLAEDSVVDRPMIPADVAERARWTMPPTPAGPLPRWIRHRPAPRETIEQIACRYRVEARQIREWNHLARDVQPSHERGRPKSLKILANQVVPERQALEHRVRAGETWPTLAHRYGVDSMDLRAWNVGDAGRELDVGERLTVWIDPIVYRSIVEDPEPDSSVRAGAHGVGTPNRGALVAGVQIPAGEHWELRYPNSAYGTTFAVRQLIAALERFAESSDYSRPIKLGTMSRPRGGQVGHHDSHQSGRDLDIRLPLRESIPAGLAPTARRVDWTATWLLIRALAETGAVQVIFLDYAMQKRVHRAAKAAGAGDEELTALLQWPHGSASNRALVRHEPGHGQHAHVRFVCGPAEPECVD
ncbi:penicillin-insensitive murein endopeptidase [Nannocystaceae bacterium ST9]